MSGFKDVRCRLGDLLETTVPGKHQHELVFGAFPADRRLMCGPLVGNLLTKLSQETQ